MRGITRELVAGDEKARGKLVSPLVVSDLIKIDVVI